MYGESVIGACTDLAYFDVTISPRRSLPAITSVYLEIFEGASRSKTIAVARRAARSAPCHRYRRRSGILVAYRPRLAVAHPDDRRRQSSEPDVYAQQLLRKAETLRKEKR
jgi:hypothetical protein